MKQQTRGALRQTARWIGLSLLLSLLWVQLLVLSGCAGFRAARLYQQGTHALNTGHSELAVRDLREAARLAPEASEISNHLGLALAATGHHTEALAAFERAVDLDCSNAAAAQNLAAARALRDERTVGPEAVRVRTAGEP
ncbi:MAG: tetratricopeptide repeat protein [bacterium]|nr:tetratricopeptide repeat protein [bacterium]